MNCLIYKIFAVAVFDCVYFSLFLAFEEEYLYFFTFGLFFFFFDLSKKIPQAQILIKLFFCRFFGYQCVISALILTTRIWQTY